MDRVDVLHKVSREAGALLADYFGRGVAVHKKGELDLVTDADLAAEKLILEGIRAAFPDDEIQAEESGAGAGISGWAWIIDPLDGTTNFSHNFPHFSVSAALTFEGELQAGVVFDPMKREFFHARKGQGAFLNETRLSVGARTEMNTALTVTGFSYDRRERMDELLDRVRMLLNESQGLRRLGSAALDMAYVAAGRFDLFLEDGLNAWDISAGALLVLEAGGVARDFSLDKLDLNAGQMLACNPTLFAQARRAFFA